MFRGTISIDFEAQKPTETRRLPPSRAINPAPGRACREAVKKPEDPAVDLRLSGSKTQTESCEYYCVSVGLEAARMWEGVDVALEPSMGKW